MCRRVQGDLDLAAWARRGSALGVRGGTQWMDGDRQREVLMAGRWWWVPWDMASPGTSQLTDQPMARPQRSLTGQGTR